MERARFIFQIPSHGANIHGGLLQDIAFFIRFFEHGANTHGGLLQDIVFFIRFFEQPVISVTRFSAWTGQVALSIRKHLMLKLPYMHLLKEFQLTIIVRTARCHYRLGAALQEYLTSVIRSPG
jgi:hypothetical protein